MKYKTLLLFVFLVAAAGCAQILGFRPPDRRPFEHRQHVLKGIHCTKCHVGISEAGDEGPLHIPGPDQCRTCHEKPHDEGACNNCHGLASTRAGVARAREILRFQHSTHVPRIKGDCVRCHLDIEKGADILRPRMATCGSCHNHKDHLANRNCDACHVNVRAEETLPDDHLIHSGNWLREHAPRAGAERQMCQSCHQERFCASCHGVSVPGLPERLNFDEPLRAGVHRAGFKARHPEEARTDPGLCTTCHSPRVCNDCHDKERVSPGGKAHSPHPTGWLGLPGQRNEHGRAAWRDPDLCASCHSGAGEQLCVGCHKVGGVGGNPHMAGFKSNKRQRVDRPCRLCHGGV